MKFLVFAASHRPESDNRKLAKLAASQLAAKHITVDFAEYAEFDMPVYNDVTATTSGVPDIAQSFAKRAASANGIIIATPEYNWSYPGSLKNILDWTSRLKPNLLTGKTALLLSATPGSRGGILGLSHLKSPLEALALYVFPKAFPLGMAHTAFTADGTLAHEKQQRQLATIIDDYITFTRKLGAP